VFIVRMDVVGGYTQARVLFCGSLPSAPVSLSMGGELEIISIENEPINTVRAIRDG